MSDCACNRSEASGWVGSREDNNYATAPARVTIASARGELLWGCRFLVNIEKGNSLLRTIASSLALLCMTGCGGARASSAQRSASARDPGAETVPAPGDGAFEPDDTGEGAGEPSGDARPASGPSSGGEPEVVEAAGAPPPHDGPGLPAPPVAVPAFAWPPPAASARTALPEHLLRHRDAKSFAEVDRRISRALENNGYDERAYFSVPHGFAVITRLEQTDRQGFSKKGPDRWATTVGPLRQFSLTNYLRDLFSAAPGYFRVIAFVVTDQPYTNGGVSVTEGVTEAWLEDGADRLPSALGATAYSAQHECSVLVYEFASSGGPGSVAVLRPGRLTGEQHLQSSGILLKLRKP
ncbi:MAG: hypothetical protein JWN04_6831 [Myxococcaceae bacterium]|nr:hypothetical protein [Myxococcaceae bacterium]